MITSHFMCCVYKKRESSTIVQANEKIFSRLFMIDKKWVKEGEEYLFFFERLTSTI